MFLSGHSLSYHKVVFCLRREGELEVLSYADFLHRENITAEHVSMKIERSKQVLGDLCERSSRFAEKMNSLQLRFLCCYDYGTAAVAVAEEQDGRLKML